ncbi:DUF5615 family PIN-like protein [Candidatus Woesearchaeota archaeon]|nr:DUF5615 family PIN-like protein [Candidatus Woesearchaeota archaeon]
MLKFLVDESTGSAVATALRRAGYDTISVAEIASGASDETVLDLARAQERILVTNDKDFGELIFRHRQPSAGVILLRLRVDTKQNRSTVVVGVVREFAQSISGHFIIASETEVRLRKLP